MDTSTIGRISAAEGRRDYPDGVIGYCRRCQNPLHRSMNRNCGVCELFFDSEQPATFLARPSFLFWKFWFPGFSVSVISGVVSYAFCLQYGDLGWALFFAVPVSVGAILGYATKVRYFVTFLLAIAAISCVVFMLISLNFAGFFCGLTLSLIFLLPVMFGILVGAFTRMVLKASRWDQRIYLPILLFALFPYVVKFVEMKLPRGEQLATVRTELRIDSSPAEAWDAIMFYEEVDHDPPWLLRLALPIPIRSVGDKRRQGELVTCFYDRGFLVKRIRRVEKNRRLTFDVIEQNLHFERDITLVDGSFELIPTGDGATIVRLETRYRRHLHPAWLWETTERKVIRTLHGHILEGMRRQSHREYESPLVDAKRIESPFRYFAMIQGG